MLHIYAIWESCISSQVVSRRILRDSQC